MIASETDQLLHRLVVLGMHHPQMRFGQLSCLAATLAGDDSPDCGSMLTDAEILAGINEHLERRFNGGPAEIGFASLTETRGAVIDAVRELRERFPNWNVQNLLVKLAQLAHVSLYDVEDGELVEAARSADLDWFVKYADQLEAKATVANRQEKAAYQCPCCRFRTLYERGGFEICPVCYWEDDGQDDSNADAVWGGPNGALSLAQARQNYAASGACDPKYMEHCRPPRPAERL